MENIFDYSPSPPSQFGPKSPRTARGGACRAAVLVDDLASMDPLDYWTEQALGGDDLSRCDSELLPRLVINLRSLRDSYLINDQTELSRQADAALVRAKQQHKRQLVEGAAHSLRRDLETRLLRAEQHFSRAVSKIEAQEKNMVSLFDAQQQQLFERQQKEVNDLTIEWQSAPRLRSYNRTSPLLRELRRQAVCLLNEKRYDEAKMVAKRADEMEAAETEASHLQMQSDFEEQLLMLTKKHDDERLMLSKNQEIKRSEHEIAKNAEISIHQKRIEKIAREIEQAADPDKVWALHHRNDRKALAETMHPMTARSFSPQKYQMQRYEINAGKQLGVQGGSNFSAKGKQRLSQTFVPQSKRQIRLGEFTSLELPPLDTGVKAKKVMKSTQRYYSFNKNFV